LAILTTGYAVYMQYPGGPLFHEIRPRAQHRPGRASDKRVRHAGSNLLTAAIRFKPLIAQSLISARMHRCQFAERAARLAEDHHAGSAN